MTLLYLCWVSRVYALTNTLADSIPNLKGIEFCTVCANKLLDKGSLQNPIKSAENCYMLFERFK